MMRRAITRPRMWSATIICNDVFEMEMTAKNPPPTNISDTRAVSKLGDTANEMIASA